MTLHTGPGCSISADGADFSGTIVSSECTSDAEDNEGCKITTDDTATYGAGFNADGGGVYASEWTPSFISVYFFPRASIPADILGPSPDPSS